MRRRKSFVASPTGVPGPRESVATDAALDIDAALEIASAGRGVCAWLGGAGVAGGRPGVPVALDVFDDVLLTAMMLVSSVLNFSRSVNAIA